MKSRQPVIINDALHDERANKDFASAYEVRSKMVLPLRAKNEAIGSFIFYFVSAQVVFSEAEIDFANKLAASISLAIENARLYAIEHTIADTLQNAFLTVPEVIDGIDFGHLYRSAAEIAKVGGDFYDIFVIDDGKVAITIGDVAGKGLLAATVTSAVKNIIRVYAYDGVSPAEVMERANKHLIRSDHSPGFVTVFFGIFDTKKGSLTYCSAGHPPAILKRNSSSIELLGNHSPVIGAFKGFRYKDASVAIDQGDTLVLYTDGVTEARYNGGFYGEDRLIDLIKSLDCLRAGELTQVIFSNILDCCGSIQDDIAILTIIPGANWKR